MLMNWARASCAEARASSRWSMDRMFNLTFAQVSALISRNLKDSTYQNRIASEAPVNVLDGSNKTWWSSSPLTATPDQLVTFDLDLGAVRPISRIQIAWGDDGQRPREMSRKFRLSASPDSDSIQHSSSTLYTFNALSGCPKERFISHIVSILKKHRSIS